MKKSVLLILCAFVTTDAIAAVSCKGSPFGVSTSYTFTRIANSKNLQLAIDNSFGNKQQINKKGIASYTSTVVLELFGEKSVQESYYYFTDAADSYTEIVSLSADMKLMASSRPDPKSETGNYFKLTCAGTL